jgi:hypothetical protein
MKYKVAFDARFKTTVSLLRLVVDLNYEANVALRGIPKTVYKS